MQLGKVVYDTLDDTGDVVREESFTYTARGRMAGAEIDADGAGSSSAAETTTEYFYDDSGFRIRQSTTHDSTTVVTEFVADANNPTGYTQTIEAHVDGELLRSYTFGMDEIVQAVKDNPAASAVVGQFLHDGRGSVRQLADALADLVQAATKDAAAVLKLDYTAYGTAVNYAAETVATALLHNGEFVDPVTGQQYLRARWYDQATGRFNRVDPFAGEANVPQSLHKYLFAHGDPSTHSDPSGKIIPALIALGIAIASWVISNWALVATGAFILSQYPQIVPGALDLFVLDPLRTGYAALTGRDYETGQAIGLEGQICCAFFALFDFANGPLPAPGSSTVARVTRSVWAKQGAGTIDDMAVTLAGEHLGSSIVGTRSALHFSQDVAPGSLYIKGPGGAGADITARTVSGELIEREYVFVASPGQVYGRMDRKLRQLGTSTPHPSIYVEVPAGLTSSQGHD